MSGDSSAERRPGVGAVASVAAVILLVTLAGLAAGQGHGRLFRGEGLQPSRAEKTRVPEPVLPQRGSRDFPQGIGQEHTWFSWLIVALEITAAVVLLGLLLRALAGGVRSWRLRRRPPRAAGPPRAEFDVLEHPDLLADDLAAGAERHRAVLADGSPRNGIVACWHEFERIAELRGMARKPWQTSSEFTLQVLDLVQADEGAVGRLAGRYREARFSDHEVTEEARAAARRDLDVILAGLTGRRIGATR